MFFQLVKMRTISIIFSLLFLGSCGPVLESICEENGIRRSCTVREQMMINDMHTIIIELYDFDANKNLDSFLRGMQIKPDPKVLFFGENHVYVPGQIMTLGAINSQAQEGDIILLEGADRTMPVMKNDYCAIKLVFRIFEHWQYVKLGQKYEPDGASKYSKQQNFSQLLKNTIKSYDLSGLNINKLHCGYWDDAAALAEKDVNYGNLKVRNRSMVKAIRDRLINYNRVFINTGLAHTPSGDLSQAHLNSFRPKNLDEYYTYIKSQRRCKKIGPDSACGNSRVVYKSLTDANIPFGEYIYRPLI